MTTILFWRDAVSLRLLFGASAACYVAIILLTIFCFVPRDLIVFRSPLQERLDEIRMAAGQWSRMNWARTLLGCAGVLCSMRALDLYYAMLVETLRRR